MSKSKPKQRQISIDCSHLDKSELLHALSNALHFGPHFGYNFDALYDSLWDDIEENGALELELLNWSKMRMTRSNRQTLISVFEEMQEELDPGLLRVKIVERIIG
ncbi:MAG: barstar family protein [Duodenibacillus sp.]|nr:barstar family protein [Duodenibacillus sp.]